MLVVGNERIKMHKIKYLLLAVALVFSLQVKALAAEIDLDITTMNDTMALATVTQMTKNPEMFQGQTIKIRGSYCVFDGGDVKLPAVIVTDITGCCAMGLEFSLDGCNFPNSYPEVANKITLIGVFGKDTDGHYRLQKAVLE